MKPARFAYVAPATVEEAVAALAAAGGQAKVLAGGQSLVPMLNFRLVQPSLVVDINRIAGLDRIEDNGPRLRIGALVRHHMIATSTLVATHVPILREAVHHVAHLTVRNRGTFCGSICHADPAAEMPMIALLLDADVEIAGPSRKRRLGVRGFLVSSLTTALAPDEMVTAIEVDKLAAGTGWAFAEFARRHGDYALACLAATVTRRDNVAGAVRIAAMGIGETAIRLHSIEAMLEGTTFGAGDIDRAVAQLRAEIAPMSDLGASADYRRHLAGTLAAKVLRDAFDRARELAAA